MVRTLHVKDRMATKRTIILDARQMFILLE